MPDSNTNIAELVRKIYLEHREAIELVIQHKPDLVDEMKQIFRDAIKRQDKWRLDCEDVGFLRFQVYRLGIALQSRRPEPGG